MSRALAGDTTPPRTVFNSVPPFAHKAGQTPQTRGGAVRPRYDDPRIEPVRYQRDDYLEHLKVDLENSRIFMDIDTFSERVLRVPFPTARSAQFQTMDPAFNALVDTIFKDEIFQQHLGSYLVKCMQPGGIELELYPLYCDMCNRVLALSDSEKDASEKDDSEKEKGKKEKGIRLRQNHPNHVLGGVMNVKNLNPDLIAALQALFDSALERIGASAMESVNWFWHMVPFLVEGKDRDLGVYDARGGYRLLNAETKLDPINITAKVPRGRRKAPSQSRQANPDAQTQSEILPVASNKKRKSSAMPHIPESEPLKKARSHTGGARRTVPVLDTDETKHLINTHEQLATYGFEALSIPGLRDSFVHHLFDRDRIQLVYFSHSLIITSTALDLTDPDGVKRFIAILIGHNRLTLRQHGVLSVVDEAESFLRKYDHNAESGRNSVTREDLYKGLTMTLPTDDGSRYITVTLGSLISQQGGIIGRTTGVYEGKSDEWPGKQFVVKLSWPNTRRTSEATYLRAATEAAENAAEDGERHWVLDHLPGLLYSHDFAIEPDSAEARIAELLKDAVYADEKKFVYEQRLLRVTVQERLFPLESLTSARDVAQVFADVAQCHAWLYDCPKILHRDISMTNIMYRVTEDGRICGVLNDFDLSSFLLELADDASSTSLQRTGTPPFMAIDLLVDPDDSAPKHLYRHDLESFFHVMAVFTTRFTLQVAKPNDGEPPRIVARSDVKPLPLESWFSGTLFSTIATNKEKFILKKGGPECRQAISDYVSSSFQALAPWLHGIRHMFRLGIRAREHYSDELDEWETMVSKERAKAGRTGRQLKLSLMPVFDDATLGNKVSYSLFMADVGEMTFEKPIVIKYEPTAE